MPFLQENYKTQLRNLKDLESVNYICAISRKNLQKVDD